MLEGCSSLSECEQVLAVAASGIQFLGEVCLPEQDVVKLETLLKAVISPDSRTTVKEVAESFPFSVALFLVEKGALSYHDGEFWAPIGEALALPIRDWEAVFGNFFLGFLRRENLPLVPADKSYRYVSSILLHCGVPQSILGQFFTDVVWPFARDRLTEWQIREQLASGRERLARRTGLENTIDELYHKESRLKRFCDRSDKIVREWLRDVVAQGLTESRPVPQAEAGYLQEKQAEIQEVTNEIRRLENRIEQLQPVVQGFPTEDQAVLTSITVEECETYRTKVLTNQQVVDELTKKLQSLEESLSATYRKVWGKPWTSADLPSLEHLPLSLLAREVERLQTLEAEFGHSTNQQNGLQKKLLRSILWWMVPATVSWGIMTWQGSPQTTFVTLLVGTVTAALLVPDWLRTFHLMKGIKQKLTDLATDMKEASRRVDSWRDDVGLPPGCTVDQTLLEELAALQQLASDYRSLDAKREATEGDIQASCRHLRSLAAMVSAEASDNLFSIIDLLEAKLAAARRRRQVAETAAAEITAITRELQVLQTQRVGLEEELRAAEAQLHAKEATNRQRAQEWDATIQRINQPGVPIVEAVQLISKFVKPPARIKHLVGMRKAAARQIAMLAGPLLEARTALQSCTGPYDYLPEPLQRFLLRGGAWAETWVVRCALFLQDLVQHGSFTKQDLGLPPRVAKGLAEWWNSRSNQLSPPTEPQLPVTPSRRLQEPVLKVDPVAGELYLVLSAQRLPLEDSSCKLKEVIELDDHVLAECSLVPLRVAGALVETMPQEYPLRSVGGVLTVSLWSGKAKVCSWSVPTSTAARPYLVFNENGLEYKGRMLQPNQRSWLFFPKKFRLSSDLGVIEEAAVKSFPDYNLFLIHVAQGGTLQLETPEGDLLCLHADNVEEATVQLVGGSMTGVTVEGNPVYAGIAPQMVVQLREEKIDLSQWTITVKEDLREDVTVCSLAELPSSSVSYDGERLSVDLNSFLKSEAMGYYTCLLTGPVSWTRHIAFLSELAIEFEPPLYLPRHPEQKDLLFSVIPTEGVKFEASLPAIVTKVEEDVHKVLVVASEDAVHGRFVSIEENRELILPVTIPLPKVRWACTDQRPEAIPTWQDQVQEVWFEDLLVDRKTLLHVRLPINIGGYVELYVSELVLRAGAPVRNGEVQFELSRYADALRSASSVATIAIRIFSPARRLLAQGPLFTLRTKWETANIGWKCHERQGKVVLHLGWEEKGKAVQKAVHLWRIWEPWKPPLTRALPGKSREVDLVFAAADLPSGCYLLQFAVEDPWATTAQSPAFPGDSTNTALIKVQQEQAHFVCWQHKWLTDQRIEITGKVAGVSPGTVVHTLVSGVLKGSLTAWNGQGTTDAEGLFTAVVAEQSAVAPAPLASIRQAAHWLALYLEEDPSVYYVATFPDPAALEWPLAKVREFQWEEVAGQLALAVATDEHEIHLPEIEGRSCQDIIRAYLQGQEYDLYFNSVDRQHKGRLRWLSSQGDACVELSQGVRCSTCGRVLPSQSAWYEHTHIHRSCKGMHVNLKKIDVRMYLVWKYQSFIERLQNRYPLAGLHVLELYSTQRSPLPEDFRSALPELSQDLALLLWEKEKERACLLQEVENSHEH